MRKYKIFTMPACDKCATLKGFLAEKKISFEEVDLGEDEGVAELRKHYPQLKEKIKRTADGSIPIPAFLVFDDDIVVGVATDVEEAKKIL